MSSLSCASDSSKSDTSAGNADVGTEIVSAAKVVVVVVVVVAVLLAPISGRKKSEK